MISMVSHKENEIVKKSKKIIRRKLKRFSLFLLTCVAMQVVWFHKILININTVQDRKQPMMGILLGPDLCNFSLTKADSY